MSHTRNRIAGVAASGLLCALAWAGSAAADDRAPQDGAGPRAQPTAQGAPGRSNRTAEPQLEKPVVPPTRVSERVQNAPARTSIDRPLVDTYLRTWPERSASAARATIATYGLPSEATPTMFVWHENGAWKQTAVYREGLKHDFPRPHADVIEQSAALRVPINKMAEIATFDGSLTVRRTEGVIVSRCESEALNFVAINLAAEIAAGKKNAAQARQAMSKAAVAIAKGEPPGIATDLRFDQPDEPTVDADKATLRPEEDPGQQVPSPTPIPEKLTPMQRPLKNGPNPTPPPTPTPTPSPKAPGKVDPNAPSGPANVPPPTATPSSSSTRSMRK
jgi:hypothetical protein